MFPEKYLRNTLIEENHHFRDLSFEQFQLSIAVTFMYLSESKQSQIMKDISASWSILKTVLSLKKYVHNEFKCKHLCAEQVTYKT